MRRKIRPLLLKNYRSKLGELGIVQALLNVINNCSHRNRFTTTLTTAWSILRKLTADPSMDRKRFIDGGGVQLFHRCREQFVHERHYLESNMMQMQWVQDHE